MTKTITLEYCGIPGSGPTMAKAKQDAARKLERLVLDCRHGPIMITMRGWSALVFRGPESWSIGLVFTKGAAHNGPFCYTIGFNDLENAQYAAARNIAQLAWTPSVTSDEDFAAEASRLVRRADNTRLYAELLDFIQWQRRYAAARAAGHPDSEAHEIASGIRLG